jgi:tetratricopeptide (TPR) repeat protein
VSTQRQWPWIGLAALLWLSSARADDPSELHKLRIRATSEDRRLEAVELATRELAALVATSPSDSRALGASALALARCEIALGRSKAAEEAFKRVDLQWKALTLDDPAQAERYLALAELAALRAEWDSCSRDATKVLELTRSQGNPALERQARTLIASCLEIRGDKIRAERAYEQSIKGADNDASSWHAHNQRARFLVEQDRDPSQIELLGDAPTALARVIAQRWRLRWSFLRGILPASDVLPNLQKACALVSASPARILEERALFDDTLNWELEFGSATKARELAEQGIGEIEKRLGPNHPELFDRSLLRARALTLQGEWLLAGTELRRAARIIGHTVGSDARKLALLLAEAKLCLFRAQLPEAQARVRSGLALCPARAPHRPRAQLSLIDAELARLLNDKPAQELAVKSALAAIAGEELMIESGSCGASEAWLYISKDQRERALRRAIEADRLAEKTFGPGHSESLAIRLEYARILARLPAPTRAEPLLKEILEAGPTCWGPGHWRIALARLELADTFRERSQRGKALLTFRAGLREAQSSLGAGHPIALWGLTRYAEHFRSAGELNDAEKAARSALTAAIERLGAQSPILAPIYAELAEVLVRQKKSTEAREARQRATELGARRE